MVSGQATCLVDHEVVGDKPDEQIGCRIEVGFVELEHNVGVAQTRPGVQLTLVATRAAHVAQVVHVEVIICAELNFAKDGIQPLVFVGFHVDQANPVDFDPGLEVGIQMGFDEVQVEK
jgi:hypothetical protein